MRERERGETRERDITHTRREREREKDERCGDLLPLISVPNFGVCDIYYIYSVMWGSLAAKFSS